MKRSVFIIYNIVGGLLWGFGSTLLGYLLGEAYPIAEKIFGRIILGLLLLLVLGLLVLRYYKQIRTLVVEAIY